MSREWTPGDVAVVQNEYGVWNTAIYVVGLGWQYGVSQSTAPLDAPTRPLVVIDPEDRDRVERFVVDLEADWGFCGYELDPEVAREPLPDVVEEFQRAFREFANPTTPKPNEPTGLGAVVEDAEGLWWVRTCADPYPWAHAGADEVGDRYTDAGTYADLSVVRVLSEGVTS